MKKFFALFAIAFAFILASCSASVSSGSVKSSLQSSGYTVEEMSTAEAKESISGVEYVVDPTSVIYAKKDGKEVILIFFFSSIDDATKFLNKNIQPMYYFAQRYAEENPRTGSHNNAAYAGTPNAVKAAGFPV